MKNKNEEVKWIQINKDEGDCNLKTDERVVNDDAEKQISNKHNLEHTNLEKNNPEKEQKKEENNNEKIKNKDEANEEKTQQDYSMEKLEVLEPASVVQTSSCLVTRAKSAYDTGWQSTYFMHSYQQDGSRKFVLAGRKRIKSATATYILSLHPEHLSRKSKACVGKIRSNFLGTQFTAYRYASGGVKEEMVAVIFETKFSHTIGLSKMTVFLPCMDDMSQRQEMFQGPSMLQQWKRNEMRELIELKSTNTSEEDVMKYKLSMQARSVYPSCKNFQLIHPHNPSYLIMQFARLSDDCFSLEYHYPLCALQAFAVVLSVFDHNI